MTQGYPNGEFDPRAEALRKRRLQQRRLQQQRLRQKKRRRRRLLTAIIAAVVLSVCIFLAARSARNLNEAPPVETTESTTQAPETTAPQLEVDVSARSALLYHAQTNRILFEKAADKKVAPASLTKLLTALTALEYCAEDEVFTVGSEIYMIGKNSSVCYLKIGWKASLKTLICGLLAASGNDAAYCIAANVAKKTGDYKTNREAVDAFVHMMNQKAKRLGMQNSHFSTPDGFDAEGQYATARDLLRLARVAMSNRIIADACGSHRVSATLADGTAVTWNSTNRFLNPNTEFYDARAVGLKTGSTESAGSCLIAAFKKDHGIYIAIVMGASEDAARYRDVRAMMKALD